MKILRNSILYVWATGIGLAQVGADSGWTFQNPQPTGNALRAVAIKATRHSVPTRRMGALEVKTMIAVGEQGSILRTTDRGVTWKRIPSGTSAVLSGISFADANTGIAVGSQGAILRTVDGGSTWTPQSSGTADWLRGASLTDAGTGTVVGDAGTILKTVDGGATWSRQSSG